MPKTISRPLALAFHPTHGYYVFDAAKKRPLGLESGERQKKATIVYSKSRLPYYYIPASAKLKRELSAHLQKMLDDKIGQVQIGTGQGHHLPFVEFRHRSGARLLVDTASHHVLGRIVLKAEAASELHRIKLQTKGYRTPDGSRIWHVQSDRRNQRKWQDHYDSSALKKLVQQYAIRNPEDTPPDAPKPPGGLVQALDALRMRIPRNPRPAKSRWKPRYSGAWIEINPSGGQPEPTAAQTVGGKKNEKKTRARKKTRAAAIARTGRRG